MAWKDESVGLEDTHLLRIYARIHSTAALGPFLRYALWVQGCPLACPGCIAPGAQPWEGGEKVSPEEIANEFLAVPEIEGITISGGEPFAQAAGLSAMLRFIRTVRDLGVIVYTGYQLSSLKKNARCDAGVASLLAETDLLIDGRYEEAENKDGGLKGSTNQVAHALTQRYLTYLHLYESNQPRRVEVHVRRKEEMLVGIPSRMQLEWWRQMDKPPRD